jgi:AAA15 family ATPase/GTPase
MLLQFKFSNFRCFAEETIFDMTATSIKEHRYSLIEKNGVNILPVSALYGANASGKSSFFMAMERMKSVVVDRFIAQTSPNENKSKPYSNPFIFDDNSKKEPSSYEVSILIGEYEYRYGFSCTNDEILSEYLYKKKLSKNTTKEKLIFERTLDSIKRGTISNDMKKEIEYCSSMSTNKILILTDIGLRKKNAELFSIFSWFLSIDVLSNATQEVFSISGYCDKFVGDILADKNINVKVKDNFKSLITNVDPSISDVVLSSKIDSEGNVVNVAFTKHIYNGKSIEIPFSLESEGTNKFIFLAIIFLISISKGTTCFIDELDSKLHPLLLRQIVQMFTDKDANSKGAQLIFSAHNIINLDSSDLRRDEIWFIEKNSHKSSLYSLVDFDDGGVRSDLSYGKHYLSGRFGAVPFQNEE